MHLIEGPLLKYRPGFTTDYISRWCRVSERFFYYYKDQHTSLLQPDTPIFAISFRDIAEIKRYRPPPRLTQLRLM